MYHKRSNLNWHRRWFLLGTPFAVVAFGPSATWGHPPCACNCDANGSGGPCDALDIVRVVGCIGMAPVGACAGSDVNCDGVIDASDADDAACGFRLLPPDVCCQPQFGSEFTYQGSLALGGVPVTDVCDFEFTLWDDPATPPGAQIGPTGNRPGVVVTGGEFTVQLSFGLSAYDGFSRWLEIAVVCPAGGGPLVTLIPRTELTAAPYAVRAGTGIGGPRGVNVTTDNLVGIGRTPTDNKLEVEGDASKTTAGGWLANSDGRIKTDVAGIENALSTLDRVRPVKFRYTDAYRRQHPSVKNAYFYNYIAQDFRKVFPDFVQDGKKDGILQMDAFPVSVVTVAAVQELHQIVQEKGCRIGELEDQNTELQLRLRAIEATIAGLLEAQNGGGR